MKQIVWTPRSVHDLQAIRDFIEQDSSHYAEFTVQRFFRAVERLFLFPESGRIVPEIQDPSLREVIIGSYRIVYRLIRDEIHIITIHHAARLFKLEN